MKCKIPYCLELWILSSCVHPYFLNQEVCYDMLEIYIFLISNNINVFNGTQNMQFNNVICCFLWYLPYFYPLYEFEFKVFGIFNHSSSSKLILAPGARIRDNTGIYLFTGYQDMMLDAGY